MSIILHKSFGPSRQLAALALEAQFHAAGYKIHFSRFLPLHKHCRKTQEYVETKLQLDRDAGVWLLNLNGVLVGGRLWFENGFCQTRVDGFLYVGAGKTVALSLITTLTALAADNAIGPGLRIELMLMLDNFNDGWADADITFDAPDTQGILTPQPVQFEQLDCGYYTASLGAALAGLTLVRAA